MKPWLITIQVPAQNGRQAETITVRSDAENAWQAVFDAGRLGHLPDGECDIKVRRDGENASC